MRELIEVIKETVVPNFLNIKTAIRAYDRDAICCNAPCWRWAYHTLHSADKWFINPYKYDEPDFHEAGMDNPDNPTDVVLSDEQLLEYLDKIEKKTLDYLDTLTDEMLYEKPENCPYTRMELVLRQYRHLSFHTGMLNGQTAVATGKFPMWVSQPDKYADDGIVFGRNRKGQYHSDNKPLTVTDRAFKTADDDTDDTIRVIPDIITTFPYLSCMEQVRDFHKTSLRRDCSSTHSE